MSELSNYWNAYYKDADRIVQLVPSQFAAFVASEVADVDVVLDLGCGSGRDSIFFARHFARVVGVDASESAIQGCISRSEQLGVGERASYLCEDIQSPVLEQALRDVVGTQRTLIYSRFFLHAITEEAQHALLAMASSLMGTGSVLALEFRTGRDAALKKETPGHFRRYIDTAAFLQSLTQYGLEVKYFVEGFGYAKYKSDDAHVARVVCTVR
jgi:cyclopropane fatty-acyl-phospholipid synthase-like methyltransferase